MPDVEMELEMKRGFGHCAFFIFETPKTGGMAQFFSFMIGKFTVKFDWAISQKFVSNSIFQIQFG